MRKTWILVGILMLLFTTYQVVSTYAKYTTQASGTAQKQAGAWVIKVNDDDISNSNANTTFDIDSLVYPESAYVAENKLAPGAEGYFEIVIDPTGSSVAIRFDVSLAVENLNILDTIQFTSACRVVNGEEVSNGMVLTGTNTYSGVISLDDVENEVETTLRFYIGWEDEETEEGDVTDSGIGLVRNEVTELPVNIVISQYKGETIQQTN